MQHPEGREYPSHEAYNEVVMAAEVRSLVGKREYTKAHEMLGRLRHMQQHSTPPESPV